MSSDSLNEISFPLLSLARLMFLSMYFGLWCSLSCYYINITVTTTLWHDNWGNFSLFPPGHSHLYLAPEEKTNKTGSLPILFEVRVGFCISGLLKKDLSDYRVIVVSSKVFFFFFFSTGSLHISVEVH